MKKKDTQKNPTNSNTKPKKKNTPIVKPPGNLLTSPQLMDFIKEATSRRLIAEEKKAKKIADMSKGYKLILEMEKKEKKEKLSAQGKGKGKGRGKGLSNPKL